MRYSPGYGVFVGAGLGMLAGVAVMTGVTLCVLERPGTTATGPGLLDVGQLAAFCRGCDEATSCGPNEPFDTGFCRGVVSGVMDSRPEIARLCLPDGWDLGQEVTLFLAWAGQHPGEARLLATDGIVRAHAASFDCRISGGGV